MSKITRRELIKRSATGLGASLLAYPLLSFESQRSLQVVVTGAHPDDPETGCGGLIALLTSLGHRVTLAYLTKGEAGIQDSSKNNSAKIRTEEAKNACKILGATPLFLGQVDGETYVDKKSYESVFEVLNSLKPDLLLTHWPIDSHRDHRACSLLTYNAWLWMQNKPDFYFYEVMSGSQTQNFDPTDFVDISSVKKIKHQACFAHKSQDIERYYQGDHGKMEKFRGLEGGFELAEAFVRHWWNPKRLYEI